MLFDIERSLGFAESVPNSTFPAIQCQAIAQIGYRLVNCPLKLLVLLIHKIERGHDRDQELDQDYYRFVLLRLHVPTHKNPL